MQTGGKSEKEDNDVMVNRIQCAGCTTIKLSFFELSWVVSLLINSSDTVKRGVHYESV
jgi:hypothetical protein